MKCSPFLLMLTCTVFVSAVSGCRAREQSRKEERAELGKPSATSPGHAVSDVVRALPDSARAADTAVLPGALGGVQAARVELWKGPGDRPFEVALRTADPSTAMSRRFGQITLRTSLRTRAADLGQYPCTSCHLGRKMILQDERVADAHQNIKVVHPRQTGGTCATCHAPDNVELLNLKSGERATLDHTYRLCAQCHFSQANAWAGGAHGKRLDGWQGRRVLAGCADCHDPHKPALEPRIPFRAPRIERTGGR
jgi:hypothetical protein